MKEKNINNKYFIDNYNFSVNTMTNYKNGRLPTVENLYIISNVLNVTMEYLLTGKNNINDFTEDEKTLIYNYRSCEEERKEKIKEYITEQKELSAAKKDSCQSSNLKITS